MWKWKGKKYFDIKLSLLPDLCAAVILGVDFMEQHESVCVKFSGKRLSSSVYKLATFSILPPRLLANVAKNYIPIALKSRKYKIKQDKECIATEVNRLLSEGIIESSTSPLRA